jgi:protocatechuate 3,4-dioxygenase beta subunit
MDTASNVEHLRSLGLPVDPDGGLRFWTGGPVRFAARPAPAAIRPAHVATQAPVNALLSPAAIYDARREAIRLAAIRREPDGPTMDAESIYARRREVIANA